MKEYTERIIPIPYDGDPDLVVGEIHQEAEKLHDEGWFFVESRTDELLSTVTLFFERDVEIS